MLRRDVYRENLSTISAGSTFYLGVLLEISRDEED